jgi:hypothetical protein
MSQRSTGLSKHERGKGHVPLRVLLYTRQQVADLLSCSVMTVIRMEQRGVLQGLRLNPTDKARVYFRASDVHTLVDKEASNA